MHTHIHTNSIKLFTWSVFLFSEYAVNCTCICKYQPWLYAYPQTLTLTLAAEPTYIAKTLTLTKTVQENAQIKRNISNSRSQYNIFTNKMHNHTPSKNLITDSRFLTTDLLMFNPTHAACSPLPSAVTRFCAHLYHFIKEFTQNPWWYTR